MSINLLLISKSVLNVTYYIKAMTLDLRQLLNFCTVINALILESLFHNNCNLKNQASSVPIKVSEVDFTLFYR